MNRIVEIKTIKELNAMTGGGVEGIAGVGQKPPVGTKKSIKKFNEEEEERSRLKIEEEDLEEEEMREEIIIERKLRAHIRNRIKGIMVEQKKIQIQEEQALRRIIRQLLKEGDISDIHPHRSTGINILEDLLKKMIPTLRTDYKRLTSDESQRKSFRAHLVKAIKDSLMPSLVNDKFGAAAPTGGGTLLSEPGDDEPIEDEEELMGDLEEDLDMLDEVDIEISDETVPGDEEKKIPVEDDDTPSEEEAFGAGLESMDETGRNMAFACYKKVQQYILDAYDSLANQEDKKVFIDYLITNTKLYFDKFEDELQKTVEEPTTDEYEQAKSGEL